MKTPEEIKKGLECCTSAEIMCGECPYYEDGVGCEGIEEDTLAYIQQLEAERDSALGLIGRLMVILKKYSQAATNGCAYAVREEIKKWLL